MHTKNMNPSISFCIDLVHCTLAKCSVLCLTGFFVCVWFTLLWQVNALVFSCTYILVMASCPSLLFALLFTSLTGFHQNIFVVYPCSSEELQYGHAILSSILSKCDITHFPLVMTSSVRYVPHLKMSKKKKTFLQNDKKKTFLQNDITSHDVIRLEQLFSVCGVGCGFSLWCVIGFADWSFFLIRKVKYQIFLMGAFIYSVVYLFIWLAFKKKFLEYVFYSWKKFFGDLNKTGLP